MISYISNDNDNSIKKPLKSKISCFTRNHNITHFTYEIINQKSIQVAVLSFQKTQAINLSISQLPSANNSQKYQEALQEENMEKYENQKILISEDGYICYDLNKIESIQFSEQQYQSICSLDEQRKSDQDTFRQLNPKQQHNIEEKQQQQLKIFQNDLNSKTDLLHFSLQQQLKQREIRKENHNQSKLNQFLYKNNNNNIQLQKKLSGESLDTHPRNDIQLDKIKEVNSSQLIKTKKQNYEIENQDNSSQEQQVEDLKFVDQRRRQIFDNLKQSTSLKSNFRLYSEVIFKRLQLLNCDLISFRNQTDNIDTFKASYQKQEVILKIFYQIKQQEVSKEILVLNQLEKQQLLHLIIVNIPIDDNLHILLLNQSDYTKIEKKLESLKSKEIKQWDLKQFNLINQPKFNRERDKTKIDYFKYQQQFIVDSLKIKNYYLSQFLTQGGEGLLFEGYKENSYGDYEDLVFKILFDVDIEEIKEELEIMNIFDKNINVIKLYDHFEISLDIFIIIIEKCQYSLEDQLKKFIRRDIEFTLFKLFQIIFDLLDGLIQFRIYNILHLDIKPANILINSAGNYLYTDFGISSLKKGKYSSAVKGFSQNYAPIEQINQFNEQYNSQEKMDYSSDIYSLGQTLLKVFEVYKKVQLNYDLSELEEIVKSNMIQIKQYDRKDCLTLHQLFYQELVRIGLKQFLEVYSQKINIIITSYPYDDENKDIPQFLDVLAYYHTMLLDILKNQLKSSELSIAQTLNALGSSLDQLGYYQESLKYKLESLQIIKRIYKGYHLEKAKALNELGQSYEYLGQYQLALSYFQQTLVVKRNIINGDSYDIAISLNNIGKTKRNLGDLYSAIEDQQEAIKITRNIFQGENLSIAQFYNDIGLTYEKVGDFLNSLKYGLKSLDLRRKFLQKNHPDIAQSLDNIGWSYSRFDDSQISIQYVQESLEMKRTVFKANHPDIATSFDFIGKIIGRLGDKDNAIKYEKASLEMRKRIYKGDHPQIAASLNNIGVSYTRLDDYENALKVQQQSLEMMRRVVKGDHHHIAVFLNNIASSHEGLGDHKSALKFFQESLEMRKRIFKGDHEDISSALKNLGSCYESLEDHKNALQYYQEYLEMRKRLIKGDHEDIISAFQKVGGCYEKIGDHKNALQNYQECLEMRRRLFKGDHEDILESLDCIGLIYKQLGDYKGALKYQQECLGMKKRMYKEEEDHHADIAEYIDRVSKSYEELGDHKNTLKYKKEALDMRRRIYKADDDHPDIVSSLLEVGYSYYYLDDYKNALDFFQEALTMRKRLSKGDHEDIAEILDRISYVYINLNDFKNSIAYQQESLEMRRRIKSGDNLDVAKSLEGFGEIHQYFQDHKTALKYFQESLNMRRRILKGDHEEIAKSLFLVGVSMLQNFLLANQIKIVNILDECLAMRIRIFKGDHPDIARTLTELGTWSNYMGYRDLTLKYELKCLEMRRRIFKSDHPDILTSLKSVCRCHRNLFQFKNASKYAKEYSDMKKRINEINKFDEEIPKDQIGSCRCWETFKNIGQRVKQLFNPNHQKN